MHADAPPITTARPLVTDLDGTLVSTDTMLETVMRVLRRRPWTIVAMLWWLRRGVVGFKSSLLRAHVIDPATLPWRQDVLDFIREQKAAGRTVVLATASNIVIGQKMADYLGCFDVVIGTDAGENLRGSAKVRAIRDTLHTDQFDYLGDSSWDLPVWRASVEALLVSPSSTVEREAHKHGNVTRIFRLPDEPHHPSHALRQAIRPVGAAIVAGGLILGKALGMHAMPWVGTLLVALGGASLWSALSIARDLLCLERDRAHPAGKLRPIAAGRWPLLKAIRAAAWFAAFAVAALAAGVAVSWHWTP